MQESSESKQLVKAIDKIRSTNPQPTFKKAIEQIETLRKRCEQLVSLSERAFAERELDLLRLTFAIDEMEPFDVVAEQFWNNLKRGFNGPLSAMNSVIEFAWYCHEVQSNAEGIRALQATGEWIGSEYKDLGEKARRYIWGNLGKWVDKLSS